MGDRRPRAGLHDADGGLRHLRHRFRRDKRGRSTSYFFALIVMMFTAISYGRMTRAFPSAGSAYTYTSETMSPKLGFLIGWAALLDYLLLPLVNALIIRSYMYSFFPDAPQWIWVVVYVAVITGLCLVSMTNTSRVNMVLVVFEVVLIGVFLILAGKALMDGMGNGTISLPRRPGMRV